MTKSNCVYSRAIMYVSTTLSFYGLNIIFTRQEETHTGTRSGLRVILRLRRRIFSAHRKQIANKRTFKEYLTLCFRTGAVPARRRHQRVVVGLFRRAAAPKPARQPVTPDPPRLLSIHHVSSFSAVSHAKAEHRRRLQQPKVSGAATRRRSGGRRQRRVIGGGVTG